MKQKNDFSDVNLTIIIKLKYHGFDPIDINHKINLKAFCKSRFGSNDENRFFQMLP